MRAVIQRVKYASCKVDNVITGSIDLGFMILLGFKKGDTKEEIQKVLKKIIGLRVFSDENGKMNKSLKDVGGKILAISQFTLYADVKHGNRPSFTDAMQFDLANTEYNLFCEDLEKEGIEVSKGIFGADMQIELLNDGPVTIIIDSSELK